MNFVNDHILYSPVQKFQLSEVTESIRVNLKRCDFQGVFMFWKAVIITMSMVSFFSHAAGEGAGSGGGGDVRCYEYSNLVGQIVKSLAVVGQEKIDSVNPLIRVDQLVGIKQKLKCLPVKKLDRQARSYSEDVRTDLLVTEWQRLEHVEKIKLASHELSVLAGYETDGEYFVSEDIVKIAIENSVDLKNQMSADTVKNNPDGSVTFHYPFTMIDGKKIYFGNEFRKEVKMILIVPVEFSDDLIIHGDYTRPDSICRYLGYNKSLSSKRDKMKKNKKFYASLTKEGEVIGASEKDSLGFATAVLVNGFDYSQVYYFQTLTCK